MAKKRVHASAAGAASKPAKRAKAGPVLNLQSTQQVYHFCSGAGTNSTPAAAQGCNSVAVARPQTLVVAPGLHSAEVACGGSFFQAKELNSGSDTGDEQQHTAALRSAFNASQPFRHCVIDNFLDQKFARLLRKELVTKLDYKSKETDLFKFHQTGDLSSLLAISDENVRLEREGKPQVERPPEEEGGGPRLPLRLPVLRRLVDKIYSAEFRQLLSEKLGCGELCERVDMAAQAYDTGCHLMCHDDVISTRKITFVLYLHDPDETAWEQREGGGMEFYRELDPKPTAEILPDFNRALFFGVEPGKSYHAVREITGDRTRLSLQGWFHAPSIEDTYSSSLREEKATLKNLTRKHGAKAEARYGGDAKTAGAKDEQASADSSDHDERVEGSEHADESQLPDFTNDEVLKRFIHKTYLMPAGLVRLRKHFCDSSEALLTNFLLPDLAQKLQRLLLQVDREDGVVYDADREDDLPALSYGVGETTEWESVGPSFMRRYLRFVEAEERAEAEGRQAAGDSQGGAQKAGKAARAKNATTAREGTDAAHAELGRALQRLAKELLQSGPFCKFLEAVAAHPVVADEAALDRLLQKRKGKATTSEQTAALAEERAKIVAQMRPEIRRFRPGLDYTIATLQNCVSAVQELDVCLTIVDDSDADLWGSEEVGGFESYVEADAEETEENAEVYREDDDDGPLVNIPPVHNALSLVSRDGKTLSFVKYVARRAPGSRVDVRMALPLAD